MALGVAGRAGQHEVGRARHQVLGREVRGDDAGASGGADEAQGAALLDEDRHRVEPAGGEAGPRCAEQGRRHFARVHPGESGDFQAQGLAHLGDGADGPGLLEHAGGLGPPQPMEAQVRLDQLAGQFARPPPGVQARNVGQRQHGRVQDVGAVAPQETLPLEVDQPDGIPGAVGAGCAQPDEGVERLAALVVGMDEGVAGPGAQPRDPPGGGGQISEPREAEIARICHEQTARREGGDQRAGGDQLVLLGVGEILDAGPLLAAQSEQARERPRQQGRGVGGHGAQGGEQAGHLVQRHLVEGVDPARGKGGQRGRGHGDQPRGEDGAAVLAAVFRWAGAIAGEALVAGLVGERHARAAPEVATGEQPPQGAVAAKATEHADQQARPQGAGG